MSAAPPLLLSILLVASTCLAGCGGPDGTAPDGDTRLPWHGRDVSLDGWEKVDLAADWSFEADFRLTQGQTMSWDWTLDIPGSLSFQLHTHDQGQLRVLAGPSTAANDEGSFTAPKGGEYSLLWTNGASAQRLWFNLDPDAKLTSYPPS